MMRVHMYSTSISYLATALSHYPVPGDLSRLFVQRFRILFGVRWLLGFQKNLFNLSVSSINFSRAVSLPGEQPAPAEIFNLSTSIDNFFPLALSLVLARDLWLRFAGAFEKSHEPGIVIRS